MGARRSDSAERVLQATVKLLADEGPTAIKARAVATASGLSTMAVYHHFGGIAELIQAVVDHGFRRLDAAFATVPQTDDPVHDLVMMALATRQIARENPHLYDLMFGLSTRATYRPLEESPGRLSGQSAAFQDAFRHVTDNCARVVASGRIRAYDPELLALQLWTIVHGFITLELAEHFVAFDDPIALVLMPIGVNFYVGLGDTRERATASHAVDLASPADPFRRDGGRALE